MTEFQANQTAVAASSALKSSLKTMARAKSCAVSWFGEILERGFFRELGYSSMNQYARVELGFSSSRTGDFMNLCRKLKKLPEVKARVEDGTLEYTKARVIVGVADAKNEGSWLAVARRSSRRELEREVKRAKKAAAEVNSGQTSLLPEPVSPPAAVVPVRVSLEMTPTQFARYEALWEQIRKKGGAPADKIEALLAVMASFAAESATRVDVRPPAQIHIHHCPDCQQTTVQSSKGELEISACELEQARCDCQTSTPGQRNTTAISPAVRHKVLARDRHHCQAPGCSNTHYLEIHHKTPRARGGSNDEHNLTTLCSACHRLQHRSGHSQVRDQQGFYCWVRDTGACARGLE